MNAYDRKPWLALYDSGQPQSIVPEHKNGLSLFRAAVARAPEAVCVQYFNAALTFQNVDQWSTALAAALFERGFRRGDRLALFMQNMPQFVIAMVAAWKAGGIVVPINPMNRMRELSLQLCDCQPRALICETSLYQDIVAKLDPNAVSVPPIIFTTSQLEFQTENDPRLFANLHHVDTGLDLMTALERPATSTAPPHIGPSDTAFLVYTSGTTGVPKGAMISHSSVAFNAQTFRDWIALEDGTPVLGVAPLFHITGLIAHVALGFLTASPLILCYRFEPGVILSAVERYQPGFAVGAITVFIALMNSPGSHRAQLASLTKIYSGGAPVPVSVVEQFQERFGHYIHNAYGLTESTAPTHLVPLRRQARVHAHHGAVSIGVPVYNVSAWIENEKGKPAAPGEEGELVLAGPMISAGYWNKPEETAQAMRSDGFRTGDICVMDEDGWFYLVDRKKDMIISSGYKVWPREVEDVLYGHPAVREAAVVPAKDDYRGETVKAVVSLKAGATATADELIIFCRDNMAAYKYPRQVVIMDELPKTPSGKILRRELR